MRRRNLTQIYLPLVLGLWLCAGLGTRAAAQVTVSPAFPTADDTLLIEYDRSLGVNNLGGATSISIHMGAVVSGPTGTTWTNVPMTWGDPAAQWRMTPVPGQPNKFRFRTAPLTVRQFFSQGSLPDITGPIYRLGMVFRSTGPCGNFGGTSTPCQEGKSLSNSDIYVDLSQGGGPLQIRFDSPAARTVLLAQGDALPILANASQSADIRLYNGAAEIANTTGTSLSTSFSGSGSGFLRVTATAGGTTVADTVYYAYREAEASPANPPGSIHDGINYVNASTVILQLRLTAEKQYAYVLGDFNNWTYGNSYRMRRRADDNNRFWVQIGGLTPGQMQRFQYEVDGAIRVGDPYSPLVLHPTDDAFIPNSTYPNRPPYPSGLTSGIVSVLQPGAPAFAWTDGSFTPPAATSNLNVYELFVYDWTAEHNFQRVIDSIPYLKRLGVNVIELMPVQEFAGNISWGYNPTFFTAVDKAYGTREKFKELINTAHSQGIAVVLDVVFNQTHEDNPVARLWWDQGAFKPAANNPYLNRDATHPFNVFFDFNHESTYTRDFVKQVCRWWIEEYHLDGFRFDLSKGFTQRVTNNVDAWSAYDASRVAILKDYSASIRSYKPNALLILEHLGVDQEEQELAADGYLLWGNMWGPYKDAALGVSSDIGRTHHAARGFAQPRLMAYMESHDEDRQQFEINSFALQNGGANSFYGTTYNARTNRAIGLDRHKLSAAFLFSIPGPKMMWQWGEMGYDVPIRLCSNGTIGTGDNCRTDPKPAPWGYINPPGTPGCTLLSPGCADPAFPFDSNRVKLVRFYSELLKLRNQYAAFSTTDLSGSQLSGLLKRLRLNHGSMNVVLLGNFQNTAGSISPNFPAAGNWYDYFRGDTVVVTAGNLNTPINLQPGEFRLLTSVKLTAPAYPRLAPYYASTNTPPPTITLQSITPTTVCPGQTLSVTFVTSSAFDSSNEFRIQLSNASGSFASPTTLSTVSGATGGVVNVRLPAVLAPGTGYLLRIQSTVPAVTSQSNSITLSVGATPPAPSLSTPANTAICQGETVQLSVAGPVAGATYRWYYTPAGGQMAVVAGATGATLQVSAPGLYQVALEDGSFACARSSPSSGVTISSTSTASPTASRPGTDLVAGGNTTGTLQWFFRGELRPGVLVQGPIVGATGATYRPLVNGQYRVRLLTAGGCRLFSNTVVVTGLSGKADIEQLSDSSLVIRAAEVPLRVKPNPASQLTVLEYGTDPRGNDRILLYDPSGRLVRQLTVPADGRDVREAPLPLDNLAPGVYLVRVVTAHRIWSERIIVQN